MAQRTFAPRDCWESVVGCGEKSMGWACEFIGVSTSRTRCKDYRARNDLPLSRSFKVFQGLSRSFKVFQGLSCVGRCGPEVICAVVPFSRC